MLSSTNNSYRSGSDRTGIVLIDGAPFWQRCLADALSAAFPVTVILEISNIEELYRSDDLSVALVLLKVQSRHDTELDLSTAIRVILKHIPSVPVIVVSACDDESIVREAMMAGAQGVVPYTASLSVAIAALRLVMAGGTCFPCYVNGTNHLPDGTWEQIHDTSVGRSSLSLSSEQALGLSHVSPMQLPCTRTVEPHTRFTAREAEVLAALQHGHPNKWIAHRLSLSENTVKFYVNRS
ncbi:response regulator transcription factor [Microvirga puerhi]|uniref:Response regulator transcription factor n=1 Tax=Microvirga puerhi TaxID=2876078 RepID=A0ABS7VT41_9HYPH|nr:response regulator transcription factor [Microvirga puerhi]MBZ6078102.1 response regulator transcription factor [Microvirga puerhi]